MPEATSTMAPLRATLPTKVYSLTDLGKKALVSPDCTAMCIGRVKVDKVVRFTEPNGAGGQFVSEVSFIASAVDVPDWVRGPEVQKCYNLRVKMADHAQGRCSLVLANDGWIDSSDIAR
ncbi:hypothetical protein [Paraburkholderia bannensis]|uniref:hypothetical protein n=1 Tax=Paraburkholderia bannensis TaxID=765414 RepID=UPI002ABDF3C4|nr:hypothetical protein [Paraburkholderia bannensis]